MLTGNSRLEEARLHVAQGEQRIADQQLRIVDLRMRDADTTSAAQILDQLRNTQRVMLLHLAFEEKEARRTD